MESREERRARLRQASRDAAAAADAQLAEDLGALQKVTQASLADLRPKIEDKAAFDQLVTAVAASTRANESIAQLRQRVLDLGGGVAAAAKAAAAILRA